MHKSWYNALQTEFSKDYFLKGSAAYSMSFVLKHFLLQEHKSHTIYPSMADIYSWSRLTPLEAVKVVILGQDPYHNVGQAHGLSFSVLPPTKIPGSLQNIYKQIANDIPSFVIPQTGNLSPIARLGVLWLNTSLTVRAHKAYSHAGKGWETFTTQVIRAVTSRADGKGVVFMAWGLPAQKTCDKIGIDETKHLVLRSPHPSPLSAHRGFIGNGHFRKANEWLLNRYGDGAEIKWDILNDK
ncbi:uracil-DNA glycosylase [Guyanagaster necrorhizus]|uniref:Uracil-DNA glycosylase n=1 Tax=Guyanagaster necrorhizus TaxID=856835 RepID=A0A9P7W5W8_9AGAR|nr:uracil-DNA glycosylase [Guyanagaster necrorhizus MCA 3950]KAG7453055.1 uracil-DNA glycosylase [Guyanagaster necrorhizus MCA 3950]